MLLAPDDQDGVSAERNLDVWILERLQNLIFQDVEGGSESRCDQSALLWIHAALVQFVEIVDLFASCSLVADERALNRNVVLWEDPAQSGFPNWICYDGVA